jgi:hypothetical protein
MSKVLMPFAAQLALALIVLPGTSRGDHGTASGQSFTFLETPFTQELVGIADAFFGGVAFAPDGDPWVTECSFAGGPLHRFDLQGVAPSINGTELHPETVAPSNAGCGLTNHPDGFMYSNTGLGVTQLDASTGAATGNVLGPPGNALGITPDPQTGDLVYVADNCRFTGQCDIVTVDPDTGVFSTFVVLPALQFIDGIYFNADGSQLFLATRSPFFAVTVVNRDAPGARTGALDRHIGLPAEPDGIAFHTTGFIVTANLDGTLSKIVPGPDTVSTFASGGGRSDLTQVGSDTCFYVTQDFFTRFDDGTTSSNTSLVRICPGFVPPPGVGEAEGRMTGGGSVFTEDGERVTHGFQLGCDPVAGGQMQIVWGRRRFHLEQLVQASCADNPTFDEGSPAAGFDTYTGSGIGRLDGIPGATILWTFTDAGEPGADDTARVVITDANGVQQLAVSGQLRNGNHQAHPD